MGRIEPLVMKSNNCNVQENTSKTMFGMLLAGYVQDRRDVAIPDEPEIKALTKNLPNALYGQVDTHDVIILDEEDAHPPRPLKERWSKVPASHRISSMVSQWSQLRREALSYAERLKLSPTLISGPPCFQVHPHLFLNNFCRRTQFELHRKFHVKALPWS